MQARKDKLRFSCPAFGQTFRIVLKVSAIGKAAADPARCVRELCKENEARLPTATGLLEGAPERRLGVAQDSVGPFL
jgi:hypothetical protein